MLKLEDAGAYAAFRKSVNRKLKAKAMQVLKEKWLLNKMAKSLFKRHEADLQRKVFTALKINQFNRINLRQNIMNQARIQSDEDACDLMRSCFEALREVRFRGRATRLARGTYGLCILRRAYASMRQFTLKQKLLQVNYNEMLILRKQRYLHKMLEAYDKC